MYFCIFQGNPYKQRESKNLESKLDAVKLTQLDLEIRLNKSGDQAILMQ